MAPDSNLLFGYKQWEITNIWREDMTAVFIYEDQLMRSYGLSYADEFMKIIIERTSIYKLLTPPFETIMRCKYNMYGIYIKLNYWVESNKK